MLIVFDLLVSMFCTLSVSSDNSESIFLMPRTHLKPCGSSFSIANCHRCHQHQHKMYRPPLAPWGPASNPNVLIFGAHFRECMRQLAGMTRWLCTSANSGELRALSLENCPQWPVPAKTERGLLGLGSWTKSRAGCVSLLTAVTWVRSLPPHLQAWRGSEKMSVVRTCLVCMGMLLNCNQC